MAYTLGSLLAPLKSHLKSDMDHMVPRAFKNELNVSHNCPNADTDLDDDFNEEEEDDDILHKSQAGSADNNPHMKQYKTGPLPVELLEEVWAITDTFDHTLVVTAEKYNAHLPQFIILQTLKAELSAEYAKEEGQYEDDPEGLEAWQEELCTLAQRSKVNNDVALTMGSKLAKFISQKKKNLMGEMLHMGTFNVHSISFIVCGHADAYAAHVQNAIICSSPEIQQLAEEEFNLKKTLDDLFVKVLAQWLDVRGLSKWHQETEKKQQEDELRSCNSAYSATSKYLQNFFIENGHTCPTSDLHQQELGGGTVVPPSLQTPQGKGCPIKLEKWPDDDANNHDDIPLIIDHNRVIVYHVQDANSGSGASSKGKNSKASCNLSKAFIENSDSEDLGLDLFNGTETAVKPVTNPSGLTEPNVGDTVHFLAIGPMKLNFGAMDLNLGASTLGSTTPGVVPQNCCYTKHSELHPSENLSTMHQVQNKGPLGPLV
ncbi:hypothetical protein BS47DRAFT_1364746 [Hydnum rufescens UP504]|uniref:Uncharacterized protein n=1 Tax=Hydnum rufescens UP504 TaxID=1448309 RepID=A0A9P6AQU0_9AGAM|nr:hypothetical protein BS47DRAFT_1364746 [Hydnum rufescens UP504]